MLRLIEAPTSHPVTLGELKEQCNIDQDDPVFNAKLTMFRDAAVQFVSDHIQRVLAPATYRIGLSGFSSRVFIPLVPVREVKSVVYFDQDGVEQTVSDNNYRCYPVDDGAVLEFLSSFSFPPVQAGRSGAVQVDIFAGYDDPHETGAGADPVLILPPTVPQAILLIAAHWHANREAAGTELFSVPFAASALLAQLRIYR